MFTCKLKSLSQKRFCTTHAIKPELPIQKTVKPRDDVRSSTEKPKPLPPGVPMSEPWPYPNKYQTILQNTNIKPQIKVSKLDNGVRVISQDKIHSPGAAVGMAVGVGSRAETEEFRGYTWFTERMAFKSSVKYPSSTTLPLMEYYGVNAYSSSHRESFMTNCEVLREYIPTVVDILYDTTFFMDNVPEEMEEQISIMNYSLSKLYLNADGTIMELLHQQAFGESSDIGKPVYIMDSEAVADLSYEKLVKFRAKYFQPQRIVLAGVGVEHEELLETANKTFGQLKPTQKIEVNEDASIVKPYFASTSPLATYRGGEFHFPDHRKENPEEFPSHFRFDASVVLAFESPCLYSGQDYYAAWLLCSMMGSGGSFSSGGPGKGMYSRVYQNILCYPYVESASTFHLPYSDTGLFGIWITGRQEYLTQLLELSVQATIEMTQIEPEEFERARNQLKSSLFANLETRTVILEDLQRQLMFYNNYFDSNYQVQMIDSLTIEFVQDFAVRMLTRRPPTIIFHCEPEQLTYEAGIHEHVYAHYKSKLQKK